MQRLYSKSTGSTYLQGMHSEIPQDAVPITEERYLQTIANPAAGKTIAHDEDGLPFLVDSQSVGPAVPRAITMRQARLLLHSRGILNAVQEAIDLLDEPPRIAAQIEWDYSSTMERTKPFVAMIAGHIGLTDEDLDAMFIEAATL